MLYDVRPFIFILLEQGGSQMRNLERALALCALLAAAPALAQGPAGTPVAPAAAAASSAPAPTDTGAVDPNQVVDVDLATGVFLDPLPFDVPFSLRGDVAAGVRSLTASVRSFPDTVNCLEKKGSLDAGPSLGPASLVTQGGKAKFLLPVPPLKVNRYYCFEFVRRSALSDAEIQAFHAAAAQAVDAALRRPLADDPQKLAAYEALRQSLIAAVKARLQAGDVLDTQEGSFFGPGTIDEQKAKSLAEFASFDQVLALQDARQNGLAEFRARQADALAAVSALVASDAYRTVAEKLAAGRQGNLSLDEFLKGKPGALALSGLDAGDLQRAVLGLAPGSELPNLDRLWASADVQAMADRLTATAGGLDDLAGVVQTLEQNPVLRAAAGLDDAAGRSELAALGELAVPAQRADRRELFTLRSLVQVLATREARIKALADRLGAELQEILPVQATTVGGFQLRASWYVSADVGLGAAPSISEVFGYVGANVYLRPVNKRAHLQWSGFRKGFWDEFGRRFAFMVGLPYTQLDKAGERTGVINSRPLMLGAGFRINDLLRVTGGALLFRVNDPDPLVDRQRIGTTPFFSLSVDWDVRSMFVNIFNAATKPAGQ